MNFCGQCGTHINPYTQICPNCGAAIKQPDQPPTIQYNAPTPTDTQPGPWQPPVPGAPIPTPRRKKKKSPIKLLIVLIALILLLIAVIGIPSIFMFPMQVSADTGDQELKRTAGVCENFEVYLQSNQPILKASYVVDTEMPEQDDGFMTGTMSGGLFKKTLTIDRLELPVGDSHLYILVRTLFSQAYCTIDFSCEIGYTSAPDSDALVEVAPGEYLVSNELILVFKKQATTDQIHALVNQYNGTIVGENHVLDEYQVRFSQSGTTYIETLMDALQAESLVEHVYFNTSFEADSQLIPNDTAYDSWDVNNPGGNNWGLEAIHAPGAWDHGTALSKVKIGLIDSYLQYDHPDLQIDPVRTHVLATDDFTNTSDINDYYKRTVGTHRCADAFCTYCEMKDHGTHCTGIAGALGNNHNGIAGVCPNAEMYFTTFWYLTVPSNGQLRKVDTLEGLCYNLTWLVVNGCRVVSISVGSTLPTDPNNIDIYERSATDRYDHMVQKLEEAGYDFLICKSAGNEDDDARNYALNRIMTGGDHAAAHTMIVAAAKKSSSIVDRTAAWLTEDCDRIYLLAGYSNYGDMVDIAAPGSDIYSTVAGNSYRSLDGTSIATPMVAGVAGLVYGTNPNWDYASVKAILQYTGKNYCEKNLEVYFMVDANDALEWAINHTQMPSDREEPELGFVTGMVQDAGSLDPIENVEILITNERTQDRIVADADSGTYEAYLEPGSYTMQFAADGYLTQTIYHVEVTANVMTYNVLLNMMNDSNENGTVSGRVIDAFDASSIPNARIEVFSGVNNTDGSPVQTSQSNDNGYYRLSLAPGNYTLRVAASGYTTGTATVLSVGGSERNDQNCTLTPILNEGEMRVILTWGAYPSDLDSHLVGPSPEGRFHTYFRAKDYTYYGTNYDNLDVDDTSSYGPETTSVYVGLDGT